MIDVRSVSKIYPMGKRKLTALKEVSFQIAEGEVLGLVGESGCGKSTLAKLLVRLEKPSAGQIFFGGRDISHAPKDRTICQSLQMIFQDPFSSLDPRMTVEDLICEPLVIHKLPTEGVVEELLDLVGLSQNACRRFPHEFSGGQRQRIGIARALALRPKFLICDEPLSSLDVTMAAQIAALLQRLQKELKLTYLFITHDLSMVRLLSDKVLVMYLGSIVEMAPVGSLFTTPLHPYTQLLIASIPIADPILERQRVRFPILGEPPSPFNPPSGCPFRSRCPKAQAICAQDMPLLREVTTSGHKVACHFPDLQKSTRHFE
ncbi:MAG TPA: ABC transporter ATP-binding protein [Chlamydiales bacterium]|jgi:oligopeptide/dipeptide ABC transporter ATP-binding protein|nr:ABC transporter ATP-binding protein [Chlamydiales bacterium]